MQSACTVDILQKRFATLHRRRLQTGNPLMPDDFRRAEHIWYKESERADIGAGDDSNVDKMFLEDLAIFSFINGPSDPTVAVL